MAISRISSAAAQTSSVALTTPTAGDLIIVMAHRDGNTAPPTLGAGYTRVNNPTGANTNSAIVGYKYSDGTETTTGTWTNATSIVAGVYRGVDPYYPIGGWSVGGGASVTLSYGTFTLWAQDNTSWVVGLAAHRTATNVTTAPTGMTARSNATDCLISDTNGTVTSWSTQTSTVNANSGWITYAIELRTKPAQDTPPGTDLLVQHICGPDLGGGRSFSVIKCPLPNPSKAGNTLVVSVIAFDAYTVSVVDDVSNTYTARLAFDDTGDTSMKLWMFVADNITANARYVTVTVNDTGIGGERVQIAEFYGCAAASFDVSHGAEIVNTTPTPLQGGSITTTQANDLVYQVAFNLGGSATQQPLLSRICKDANMTLLATDLIDGSMAQYGIKASAGAFNPAFYVNPTGTTTTDKYLVGTLALKTQGGNGVAGSGKRIVRVQACNYYKTSGPIVDLQFPCTGNLLVNTWFGFNQTGLTAVDLNSMADGAGNTWSATGAPNGGGGAGSSSMFYAGNATAYPNMIGPRMTLSAAQEQSDGMLYDLAGMHTSPFDVDATASGTQSVTANLTTMTITPTNTDGIVIAVVNIDLDTLSGLVGGSSFFQDMQVYPEADGSKAFYEDGGKGHVFNSSASAITFTWTVQGTPGGVDTWVGRAAAFKAAAAGGGGGTNHGRMTMGLGR